jgi:GNAT superfamily N-acetyltransferase
VASPLGGYNKFYGRSGATALADEITQTTWARFFDANEPVHALVAEDEGQLVGLVHYLFHRSTISIAPTCYLQDLFTGEATRGKGIGRALIGAVYEQARLAGLARVYWHTHASNSMAMKLYDQVAEHSGFVVYRKNLSRAPPLWVEFHHPWKFNGRSESETRQSASKRRDGFREELNPSRDSRALSKDPKRRRGRDAGLTIGQPQSHLKLFIFHKH